MCCVAEIVRNVCMRLEVMSSNPMNRARAYYACVGSAGYSSIFWGAFWPLLNDMEFSTERLVPGRSLVLIGIPDRY